MSSNCFCTNREYHVQHNKFVKHQDMKMYCATKQLPELNFPWTQNKPQGVCGLGKNYHMPFDPKLEPGTYSIHHITCACISCTSIIDQPWIPGFLVLQKLLYQPVKYFT